MGYDGDSKGGYKYNGYVGAPYNFVAINKTVIRKNKEELQTHNVIDNQLKSGKICYEIEAVTPIFVSEGKKEGKETEEFYRNCYGNYAIPGSTIRGLVRSNVQILSSSSIAEDIQDGVLMYRNVANGKEKDAYNTILGNKPYRVKGKDGKMHSISVLKNVKAGYITRKNGKYTILPSVVDKISDDRGEMNYYIVSERIIMESEYQGFEELKFMELQNENKPLDKKTGSPFVFEKDPRNGRVHYKGKSNVKYKPYACEVYYLLKGENKVVEIHPIKTGKEKEEKKGYKKGYLLSSGPMSEKKVIYVIPQLDEKGECIPIPAKDIDNYQRDYEGKKNQIETIDKSFYRLPQEGEIKPVFYIQLGSKLYFGFTPRLRLFYEKSIYEGLSDEQKKTGIDYARSLFGYSNDKESYKSRLSFMDAELNHDRGKIVKDTVLILGGPKPTSYLDYLQGEKGKAVSYNQDFELRGIKQYWLKDEAKEGNVGKNDKVVTRFRPYEQGAVFCGEIRFNNLSKEELGLLLWGLFLEEGSNQNIGKGKPYGYGQIKVRLTQLQILNQDALYGSDSLCMKPYQDETSQKDVYISGIKEELSRLLGREIMKEPRIKDFFLMKDAGSIPPKDRTRYMDINLREYQSRVTNLVCLPGVKDVVEGNAVVVQKDEKKDSGNKWKNDRNSRNKDSQENNRKQNVKGNDNANKANSRDRGYSSGGNVGTSMGDLLKGIKVEQ